MFVQVNIKEFCVVHFFLVSFFIVDGYLLHTKRQEQNEFIFYWLSLYELKETGVIDWNLP